MSETADYSPGDWKGYDFKSARKTYDKHVGRSYSVAKKDNKRVSDLVPDKIKTKSKSPLTILVDVTGSMGDWPAVMFSKLPYMDNECKEYLGEDMEISFAAVGDVTSDQYPVQIRPFTKGRDMEKQLKELVIEGNGGGQARESYEVTALYYAHNAEMPNAARPIMIIIGDEGFYTSISKEHAKIANVKLASAVDTVDVFAELSKKFAIYLIRKPYFHYADDDAHIQKTWEDLLGKEHIANLSAPERVVDVIFGILAKERDMLDYFKEEIEERQDSDQVKTVYKSLKKVHALPAKPPIPKDGKSVFHKGMKGKKTQKLLS